MYYILAMYGFLFYDRPEELKDVIDDLEGDKEVYLKEILGLKSEV